MDLLSLLLTLQDTVFKLYAFFAFFGLPWYARFAGLRCDHILSVRALASHGAAFGRPQLRWSYGSRGPQAFLSLAVMKIPCGMAIQQGPKGQLVEGPTCRATYNRTLDGPVQDYTLPPICIPHIGAESRSIVLAAFLNAAPNVHGGAFRKALDVRKHVRDLMHRSPGICPEQLHVVHDKPNLTESECCGGVRLHRFPGDKAHLGNDQRWPYVQEVLRRPSVQWECAYVIDFDVSVLCLPACDNTSDASSPTSKLIASGEVCKIAPKQWLYAHAARMGYEHLKRSIRTWTEISVLLNDQQKMVNCAMVGGRRAIFEPALAEVVEDYKRLWRTRSLHHWSGPDMLMWNGQALKHGLYDGGVVTGYPHGPVNLPLDGKLAAHVDGAPFFEMCLNIRHADPANGTLPCTSKACLQTWAANVSLNRFYFAHKTPNWALDLAIRGSLSTRRGSCRNQRIR